LQAAGRAVFLNHISARTFGIGWVAGVASRLAAKHGSEPAHGSGARSLDSSMARKTVPLDSISTHRIAQAV